MSFGDPLALAALAIVPVVAWLWFMQDRRRRRAAGAFTNLALLPNLETFVAFAFVFGLVLVPAGVPRDIIALLHDEIARAVALPDVEARLLALGFEPFAATPDEVAALIKRELPKWAGVIRAAGIKPN